MIELTTDGRAARRYPRISNRGLRRFMTQPLGGCHDPMMGPLVRMAPSLFVRHARSFLTIRPIPDSDGESEKE